MFQSGSGSVSLNWRSAGNLTRSRRSIRLRTSSLVNRELRSRVWFVTPPLTNSYATAEPNTAGHVQNEHLLPIGASQIAMLRAAPVHTIKAFESSHFRQN